MPTDQPPITSSPKWAAGIGSVKPSRVTAPLPMIPASAAILSALPPGADTNHLADARFPASCETPGRRRRSFRRRVWCLRDSRRRRRSSCSGRDSGRTVRQSVLLEELSPEPVLVIVTWRPTLAVLRSRRILRDDIERQFGDCGQPLNGVLFYFCASRIS